MEILRLSLVGDQSVVGTETIFPAEDLALPPEQFIERYVVPAVHACLWSRRNSSNLNESK